MTPEDEAFLAAAVAMTERLNGINPRAPLSARPEMDGTRMVGVAFTVSNGEVLCFLTEQEGVEELEKMLLATVQATLAGFHPSEHMLEEIAEMVGIPAEQRKHVQGQEQLNREIERYKQEVRDGHVE